MKLTFVWAEQSTVESVKYAALPVVNPAAIAIFDALVPCRLVVVVVQVTLVAAVHAPSS